MFTILWHFAALNRGRHLCSAGRPSGWALAHILVAGCFRLLRRVKGTWPDKPTGFLLGNFGALDYIQVSRPVRQKRK